MERPKTFEEVNRQLGVQQMAEQTIEHILCKLDDGDVEKAKEIINYTLDYIKETKGELFNKTLPNIH